jgi:hypothetical protein
LLTTASSPARAKPHARLIRDVIEVGVLALDQQDSKFRVIHAVVYTPG